MSSQGWTGTVSADRRSAQISIPQANGAAATMTFESAEDLQRLINTLGALRSQMLPAVPAMSDGTGVALDQSPATCIALSRRVDGMRPLIFRHVAFGWVGFLFDEERAAALTAALSSQRSRGGVSDTGGILGRAKRLWKRGGASNATDVR
jgi:hypothetical protein